MSIWYMFYEQTHGMACARAQCALTMNNSTRILRTLSILSSVRVGNIALRGSSAHSNSVDLGQSQVDLRVTPFSSLWHCVWLACHEPVMVTSALHTMTLFSAGRLPQHPFNKREDGHSLRKQVDVDITVYIDVKRTRCEQHTV